MWGASSLVVSHPRSLCRLQDPLAEEREAGPPIALALGSRQAMALAFRHAMTPCQGAPGFDRHRSISPKVTKTHVGSSSFLVRAIWLSYISQILWFTVRVLSSLSYIHFYQK
jgi:hypothetical protein